MNTSGAAVAFAAGTSALLLLGLSVWVAVGLLAAWVARQKGRSGCAWFVVAMFFGPLAFLALIAVPSLKPPPTDDYVPVPVPRETPMPPPPTKACPRCAESVRTEAQVCRFCGYEFTSAETAVPVEVTAALGHWLVRESSLGRVQRGSQVDITEDGTSFVISSGGTKLRVFRRFDLRCAQTTDGSGHLILSTADGVLLRLDPVAEP